MLKKKDGNRKLIPTENNIGRKKKFSLLKGKKELQILIKKLELSNGDNHLYE